MLPVTRGAFRVDVSEHEEELIVVAYLPGVEKEDISLQLLNPRTLETECERKGGKEEKEKKAAIEGERVYGSLKCLIAMPAGVTEEDAKASFKNGVLEIRLNKKKVSQKSRIEIK